MQDYSIDGARAPAYRLAIFDFDGTLLDSFGWFLGVLDQLAKRHRFQCPPPQMIEALRGQDARAAIRHLNVAWWRLPIIVRDCRQLAARDLDRMRMFDGVEPMLRELAAAGLALAVVSSNSQDNVQRALGASASLIQHFDCGGGLFRKRAGLRRVLRRAGVASAHAIYIGDEIRDWQAAQAAGIDFGAASWGYTRRAALEAIVPSLVFENVPEIAKRLTSRQV